jgi:endonuclease YncB( thermonuclease family)
MFLLLLAVVALASPPTATVVKVYDGDTFTLDNGDKVRLKWVNTPERKPPEPFHAEATRVTEKMVLGRQVSLLVDPDNARDGYGRLIAGILVGEQNLSLRLIEEGLGHVFLIPPEPDDPSELLAAQERARAARKGIWSTDRYASTLHISSFHADARGDDDINVNGEYLRLCNITAQPLDVAGYALVNRAGERFELPSLIVPAGHTVIVTTGRGEHQADPSLQLQIYLGRGAPIWDDAHDVATLLDPAGERVDVAVHGKPPSP